jgi:hypothetical protein
MWAATDSATVLVGTYNAGALRLILTESGDYTGYSHAGWVCKGNYRVEGETITFKDIAGANGCAPEAEGQYTWKYERGRILLQLIDDPCEGRVGFMTYTAFHSIKYHSHWWDTLWDHKASD